MLNRTRCDGETVVRQQHSADMAKPVSPVVIGLDGGHIRNRHSREGRHFRVVAGKVIDAEGDQHRFAFVRNGPVAAAEAFKQALAAAGVEADTPATVVDTEAIEGGCDPHAPTVSTCVEGTLRSATRPGWAGRNARSWSSPPLRRTTSETLSLT